MKAGHLLQGDHYQQEHASHSQQHLAHDPREQVRQEDKSITILEKDQGTALGKQALQAKEQGGDGNRLAGIKD